MSRREKLIDKIRARPPEADFDDVRRLIEEFGWHLRRQRGSHVVFAKKGEGRRITFPVVRGRRVKRVYLARICEILGLE